MIESLKIWRNIPDFRDNFREFREINSEQQMRWFESVSAPNSIHHMFGITDKESGELIGAAGLCYIHWAYRTADLSFYIGKDGLYADGIYGRDTVEALLKYGFGSLNLNRIWCELYETDSQKIKLLESLNFLREGRLRSNAFKNGKYVDGFIYGKLKSDR